MASIYADRVEPYARNWHRPWLVLLAFMMVLWGLEWLTSNKPPAPPVVCEGPPGSKYRAGVEVAGLPWTGDLDAALACALKDGRQVFVAFHAVTDVNARINEAT